MVYLYGVYFKINDENGGIIMDSNVEQVDVKKVGGNKKKWIIGVIIAVVVLALWVPSMANQLIAKIAPDKYVALSLLEMQKLVQKENKNYKLSLPENRKTSLDLNLKEIDGIYDTYYKEIVEGLGLSFTVANSHEGDIKVDAGIKKNGMGLVDLSIYSSKNQLGIKIPGILDQYVMVDLNQFKDQYDASELNYYMGNIEQEEVDTLKDSITQVRDSITGQMIDTYASLNEDYKQVFLDVAKDINIKYTGTSKTTIHKKKKKVTTFLITIDAGDIKSFARSFVRATLRNKDVRKNLETLYDISDSYYTLEYFEEMFYEALNEIRFSDIEIVCLIDQKKRIISAELTTAMNLDSEKVKVALDYALSGGDSLFDQAVVNLRLQSDYDKLQFSMERDKTTKNKKTTEDLIIRFRDDSEQILRASLNVEHDLAAKQDNYALTANVTAYDDTKFNVKLAGDLVTSKNSSEISFDANKMSFSLDSYGQTFSILGSGRFEVQDLKSESIAISTSQKLDLFSMDIYQMFDIIDRISYQFSEFQYMF